MGGLKRFCNEGMIETELRRLDSRKERGAMKMVKGNLLAAALVLAALVCAGCGRETEERIIAEFAEDIPEKPSSVIEGDIELKEDLQDRYIAVPDYLEDGDTGETIRHLSGEEQTEEAGQIADHIKESVNQVLTDKDFYPHITGISVNPECTEFNVTLSSREVNLYENVLPMSLCIVGNKFQLYQGKDKDELMTVVNYIDGSNGEVFATANSKDIE